MIRHATLDEVASELALGMVTEADLRDPAFHLDGFADFGSQRVYVNPKPSVVETLIHELLHRRFRRWGERRVDAEAKRLLNTMTGAQIAAWYRTYQRIKRTRKSVKRIEDE